MCRFSPTIASEAGALAGKYKVSGDAVHSFTRPDAGTDKSKGAAYQEAADKRSWEAMKGFYGELFGPAGKL